MGVSGQIRQKMPKNPIGLPREDLAGTLLGNLLKCNFQFVNGIGARLVDTRMLAGRSNEHSREQVGERWMVVPEADHASQEIRAAQKTAVGCRGTADHDVVASAGARVLPI